jgi:hypothetical protein
VTSLEKCQRRAAKPDHGEGQGRNDDWAQRCKVPGHLFLRDPDRHCTRNAKWQHVKQAADGLGHLICSQGHRSKSTDHCHGHRHGSGFCDIERA